MTWRVAGPTHDDDAVAPAAGGATSEFEAAARRSDARARAWHDDLPELRNAPADVALALRTGVDDLGALQVDALVGGVTEQVPAAGLPWFMATFGRDTLITCLQGMALGAHRVAPALRLLAELQATTDDPHVDAEPGKVLHELRDGAIAEGGFGTYYGSIDSTPLWLVTLDEYHRWTGDDDLVRELEPAARAALRWIAEHGDSDGDGLIDWLRRSEHGLQNQSWKDSHDSQRFTDGSFATGAIAPLEAQGYAVDAQLRAARLARDVWNDPDFAQALEARAEALRDRIDAAFWVTGIEDSTVRRSRGSTGLLGGVVGASGGNVDVEADDPRAEGWYALAVDGDGRKVDALASNIGHLLWSGAARPERVPRTVAQLAHPALATGWGVRTMSTLDAAYHPLSYHCGTVWPHDTSLCIAGLARAGAGEQAAQLARGLFAAAAQLDGRLPEVLSGLERDRTGAPVPYPTTCSPQAWAAAAPVFVLTELLGLAPDPDAGVLAVRPGTRAPEWLHGVEWRGIPAQGGLWNVVVDDAGVVNVQPAGRPDPRR